MSELDVEKLRREIYNGAGGIPVDQTLLTVAEWKYIARVLEDGERLRAAAHKVRYEIGRQQTLADVPQLRQIGYWHKVLDVALEGRNG